MLVFDRELSPTQVRSLSEATDLKIIDRSQLILDILRNARSPTRKIRSNAAEISFAAIDRRAGFGVLRLAGGIGGRPVRRSLMDRRACAIASIAGKETRLKDCAGMNAGRLRTRNQVPILIVGYTNAGKSTLLNALTNSEVRAEQRMFATLDPTSRRLRLPREQEIIINDTVGFIRDLPPGLLSAFRATLEEIGDSTLLIHLVDISNPRWPQQIQSVQRILEELHIAQIPTLLALNKADLVDAETLQGISRPLTQGGEREVVTISATERKTLPPLLEKVGKMLSQDLGSTSGHDFGAARISQIA